MHKDLRGGVFSIIARRAGKVNGGRAGKDGEKPEKEEEGGIKRRICAYNEAMLKTEIPRMYKVKRGQTIRDAAEAFRLPESAIIACNRLDGEPREGEILRIPDLSGNLYTARAGEDKKLLCGSEENFREKNMTDLLYPGMRVLL